MYHNRGVLADGGGNEEMLEWSHENEKRVKAIETRIFSSFGPQLKLYYYETEFEKCISTVEDETKNFPSEFSPVPTSLIRFARY